MSRTPAPEVAPPDLPGYRFVSHIGAGGNAQVYLYEQDLPHRKVAVKVLNESALSDDARRRFTAEANVTADLAHRHIVQVFDANVTSDGRPYIVMPYYPQPNLSVRARRSHFSVADVLRIGIQVGSAVETSHRRDVLHRDIKPQNILTDSYGEPALTDFGIATTTGGDGPEGLSVPWSPPEILYGTSAGDQRADVYSLGATLWHLLVGRSPFELPGGDNGAFALMGRIKSGPPPRTQRADVPDSLERLLRQAMAKDPGARPQSAMELIRGLQAVEQELRLPLTQPVLPADEVQGDTRDGDTVVMPRGGGAEKRLSRGQAPGPVPIDVPASWAAAGSAWPAVPPAPGSQARDGRAPDPQARSGQAQSAAESSGEEVQPPWAGGAAPGAGATPSAWHDSPHEATVRRGDRPADPEDDPTRRRGPVRADPWGPASQSAGDRRPARGPARPDLWGAPPAGRSRQLPPDAPEGATVARASALHPEGQHDAAEAAGARTRRRALALAASGVLLAAVAAVAAFTLWGGSAAQPAPAPTGAEGSGNAGGQSALGPGATAPGTPVVTAHAAGAAQVRFTWKYANPADGDTFRWQRNPATSGTSGGEAVKPDLVLSLSKGQSVCIVVRVTRADGQASDESQPACWSH